MMSDLQAGRIIASEYRLEELLGAGGYGEVWRATQLLVDRQVAIKFLKVSKDRTARQRFEREAKALASISHPNCVTLFDFGHLDGKTPFLVTELVEGTRLDTWGKTQHSLADIVTVASQIAAALAAAHHKQVVHRDLKPTNIMVTRARGELVVTVLDFGLAKIVDEASYDITQTGEVVGTVGFMSPEQLRGREVGPATDLYCLGAILFELLEGRPVFIGATHLEVGMAHLTTPAPELMRDVPDGLRAIVARLLEKEPDARYASADAVSLALENVREPRAAVRTTALALAPRAIAEQPRFRLAYVVGGLCLVAFVIIALVARERPVPEEIRVRPTKASAAALLKRSAPAPVAPAVSIPNADAGADAGGCGQAMEAGAQRLQLGFGSDGLLAYVPKSYDPSRPYPVVVMLHENLQTPAELLRGSGFMELADRDGFVLLVPSDVEGGFDGWETKKSQDRAWYELERAGELLCLDRNRVFIFGYGAGGFAGEEMSCRFDGIRAIASSSHRLESQEGACDPITPVPYLFVAPMKDGWDPVGGGVSGDCFGAAAKRTLAEHLGILQRQRKCGKAARADFERSGSRCYDFQDCDVDLRVCEVNGGRPWPEFGWGENRLRKWFECGGEAAPDFPFADTVWNFFRSVDVPVD